MAKQSVYADSRWVSLRRSLKVNWWATRDWCIAHVMSRGKDTIFNMLDLGVLLILPYSAMKDALAYGAGLVIFYAIGRTASILDQ